MDAAAALHPIEDQPDGLSCREREMLAFERQWWRYAGAKEQARRHLLCMLGEETTVAPH